MPDKNKKTLKNYYQAVNFLESLNNLPKINKRKNSLVSVKRFALFLKLIGNPQKKLKFIHVAGTAGKGSTVNYLHNILQTAGYKVGSYTSPHSTTTIERIKIGKLYISPTEFTELIEYLKPFLSTFAAKNPYGGLSYFETLLALAFLYFGEKNCDYVILEAGVGGLTDATNTIPSPVISIITNINLDHTNSLGRSLKKITANKAGIIKNNSFFITGEKKEDLKKLLKNICRKKGAKFIPLAGKKFITKHHLEKIPNPANLKIAITAAKQLLLNNKHILQGIKQSKLPCRFEIIQKNPLIIFDGSHNPAKINSLVSKLTPLTNKSLILIFGCAEDKDAVRMLEKLLPITNKFYLTRFDMPFRQSADLKKLRDYSLKLKPKLNIQIFLDPRQALTDALKMANKDALVLITGSFFLCGALRQKWISEEWILKNRRSF